MAYALGTGIHFVFAIAWGVLFAFLWPFYQGARVGAFLPSGGEGPVQTDVLRSALFRAVAAAGAVLPHAHDRLFRGDRQRARHCVDSFSRRDFLRLSNRDKAPDHSWLSRTRSRLPHEAHEKVFGFMLRLAAEDGLAKGERIGVDGSTIDANAALRAIVRRDNGESYREMLTRMAEMPRSQGHAFYDRLQELLRGGVRRVRGRGVCTARLRAEDGRPRRHQVTLIPLRPPHRHRRLPCQSATSAENQHFQTS
jgi:Transposase domain (DUF772)